jgi:hypothetical protein
MVARACASPWPATLPQGENGPTERRVGVTPIRFPKGIYKGVASKGRAAREASARAEPRPTIAVCAAQKGYRQEERETPQILLNFTPFVLVPVGEETDSPI